MLANQIMLLRKKTGMSQLELAKKLNIGPSAIGMYEQGRRTPSVDLLIDMANLFGVSLDYLITGTESTHAIADKKYRLRTPSRNDSQTAEVRHLDRRKQTPLPSV